MLTGSLPALYARETPYADQIIIEDADGNPMNMDGVTVAVGIYDGHSKEMTATVTIIQDGLVAFSFPSVKNLCGKVYQLACDVTRDGQTYPLFRLNLPVISEFPS